MYTGSYSTGNNGSRMAANSSAGATSRSSSTPSGGMTISAENVIQTNERMFISREMREMLYIFIDEIRGTAKRVMYTQIYDQDEDGIVDYANIANIARSVDWHDIKNGPECEALEVDLAARNRHTHDNRSVLDNIGVDEAENLTYNGHSYVLPKNVMLTTVYDIDKDGIIDKALYAERTTWAGVRNKPLTFTPSEHSHNIDQITGDIDADTFNGHKFDDFLTKETPISITQISDLDKIAVVVPSVDGGDASTTYDDGSDYTQITIRRDTTENLNSINPKPKLAELIYETPYFRYKIGNGVLPWNGLPYMYNTPNSIKFNTLALSFASDFYDYGNQTEPDIKLYTTPLENEGNKVLYNGAVKGYDGRMFAVPYSAKNVLYCDNDITACNVFGNVTNDSGAGWFGGVCYKNIIYCAPYNSEKILKIDTENLTVSELAIDGIGTNTGKYMGAILAPNNKIYFVPHNTNKIMEFDPDTEIVEFYTTNELNSTSNCCKIVYNPVDDKLYLIPKNISSIMQFDYKTKEIRTVANVNDSGVDKYSTAVLAENGLIYMIPGYGYNYLAIFDPNLFIVRYVQFNTVSYEFFNDAVIGPSSKIYLIPSGSGCTGFVSYNTLDDSYETFCSVSSSNDRWSAAILKNDGKIVCMPYVSTRIFEIDIHTTAEIPDKVLSAFNM